MKVVLFNCKFSENLGDGLIAEALEHAIGRECPGTDIRTCDIAGRTVYGDVPLKRRLLALQLLGRTPPAIRRVAVAAILQSRINDLRDSWRTHLEGADLVIIGGGHLFQDTDLNFPMKLGAVLDLCVQMRLPVAVHGVGVTPDWSRRGKTLFGRILATECPWISVRDRTSQQAWRSHFGGASLPAVEVGPDCALLTEVPTRRTGHSVGLNVMHPVTLAYHAEVGRGAASRHFFRATAEKLAAAGHEVTLFTNGAEEDEMHLREIMTSVSGTRIRRAPRPRVPNDLIAMQTEFKAVISYRLHASVLAFRLGIPAVGLGWDRKVADFYTETGREAFFLPQSSVSPSVICRTLEAALEEGIEPASIAAATAAARKGIRDMLQRVSVPAL